MLPIAPLMIEHRLIEKAVSFLRKEEARIARGEAPRLRLIEDAADFFRTYTDRCHHGKEEDLLFAGLSQKPISSVHRQILNELIEEHRAARRKVEEMTALAKGFEGGYGEELKLIAGCIGYLADLYPRHIEKEERHVFLEVMHYFSDAEKESMLEEENKFDRDLIHRMYREKIELLLQGA